MPSKCILEIQIVNYLQRNTISGVLDCQLSWFQVKMRVLLLIFKAYFTEKDTECGNDGN